MLPGLDGIGVCRRLREAGIWGPVPLLAARDGPAAFGHAVTAGNEECRRVG